MGPLFLWFVKKRYVWNIWSKQERTVCDGKPQTCYSVTVTSGPSGYPEARPFLSLDGKVTLPWKQKSEVKFSFYCVFWAQFLLSCASQPPILNFSLILSFCQNITLKVADPGHIVFLKSTFKEDANRKAAGINSCAVSQQVFFRPWRELWSVMSSGLYLWFVLSKEVKNF